MNERFSNPVSFDDGSHTNPDPYVARFLGLYYCYSTDDAGVQVSVSEDLVAWEYKGFAYVEEGRHSYWAPCVVYRNGTFYMYVSNREVGEEDSHRQRMRVATATDPLGPFTYRHTMKDTFCIDADVVIGTDGQPVMFYATNDATGASAERAGTAVVVDRMDDMLHLAGRPRPVIVPTLDEEIFARNRFGDGRDWHTVEGSTYVTFRDKAYMTYSGNAYEREDYFVGVSSASLNAPIDELEWTKQPDDETFAPLLRRTGDVEGTGHNSITVAPNLVDPWIVYHGRDAHTPLDPSREQRVMRIDPLVFRGGQLECDGPSSTPIPRPARPDVFHRTLGETTGVGRGRLEIASAAGPYRAEVNLRLPPSDMGAIVGLETMRTPEECWTVWLDAALGEAHVEHEARGVVTLGKTQRLPALDLHFWQALTIDRGLTTVTVRSGREVLMEFPHSLGATAADVALVSQFTRIEAGPTSLTQHLEWDRAHGEAISEILRASPAARVTEHGLHATSLTRLSVVAPTRPSRVTADVLLRRATSSASISAAETRDSTPIGATGATQLTISTHGRRAIEITLEDATLIGLTVTSTPLTMQ